MIWLMYILSAVIAYLLGSISVGIITSKLMGGPNLREVGSGNTGATNALRAMGIKGGIIVFVGDILKTIAAVMVGWCVFGYLTAYIAGFACFIGHIFPVFYRFRGGKGVVCMASLLLMLDWRIFCILVVIFVASVACTKYISFGSVLCSMLFPLILNRMNNTGLSLIEFIALAIAVVVVIKHVPNIKRIFKGTESKFEFKKSRKADAE